VELISPTFYKSPSQMFLGDFRDMNGKYIDLLAIPDQGIDIKKQKKEGL